MTVVVFVVVFSEGVGEGGVERVGEGVGEGGGRKFMCVVVVGGEGEAS